MAEKTSDSLEGSDRFEVSEQKSNVIDKEWSLIEQILTLKQQKANAKTTFTKAKNKLYNLIEAEELPSRRTVREGIDKINSLQAKAIAVMVKLTMAYAGDKQREKVVQTETEIGCIETETADVINTAQRHLDQRSDVTSRSFYTIDRLFNDRTKEVKSNVCVESTHAPQTTKLPRQPTCGEMPSYVMPQSESQAIGNDLWKQLKRVSIPVFSGDVKMYESWKAAFVTCIDRAPATAEYKLLQLRQYLSGSALKVIQGLGHSTAAYDMALERLERKFGGRRRQISLQLETLSNFKPIRQGCAKDLEKFADVLDIAVANLREADRFEELGNGLLYSILLKKMTETMIAQYQRWLHDSERQESVESLREWILQESEYQTIASETVHGIAQKGKPTDYKGKGPCTFVTNQLCQSTIFKRNTSCKVCGDNHDLWRCREFRNMSVSDRWDNAKKHNVCFRCLGYSHLGAKCNFITQCGIGGCTKTHNRLLHDSANSNQTQTKRVILPKPDLRSSDSPHIVETGKEYDVKPQAKIGSCTERAHTMFPKSETRKPLIALRTVPVILTNGKRRICVNALLDDASSRSYLNDDVASELGLKGPTQTVSVNVLNGNTETFQSKSVSFHIASVCGNINLEMLALTTTQVTGDMQVMDWERHKDKWNHLQNISFPTIGRKPKVDLLIGIDYLQLHQSYEDVSGQPGDPIARRTPLGWTCIGNIGQISSQTNCSYAYYAHGHDVELSSLVRNFWEIEEVTSHEQILSPIEKQSLEKAHESLAFEKGRYQIGIPWKQEVPCLPNNYDMALRRLVSTEKRLKKDKCIAQAYGNVISEYEKKGYISKVSSNESDESKWYLPHFPILRPDKATTKVRIVFDASARYKDISLNDKIDPGPKLHSELFDVLLRFRRYPVALICDIAEMFLQIELAPSDRSFHRFLWRSMNTTITPEVYQFNRVVFGNTSSPFLAQFVSQQHAKIHQEDLPRAVETVLESTYMDDSMDSVEDEDEGLELYKQLSELWSGAAMHARKWLSNSLRILDNIPVEDRTAEIDLSKGHLPSVKTLGLMWIAKSDMFTFSTLINSQEVKTKRDFLSHVSRLFDPLGLISPFIITAKIILQEIWLTGQGWDDCLPQQIKNKVSQWLEQWSEIQTFEIPRCLRFRNSVEEVCLHCFVDASQEAYGAAVYAVHTYLNESTTSRLVSAKSRVAPLKSISIPRLELMAAIVGVRLVSEISRVLNISIKTVRFWSDSMNVLCCLKNNSRTFKPFVANRVGEIHCATNPSQWRHVSSIDNPADLLTRGTSASQLKSNQLWWSGPSFLVKGETEWPTDKSLVYVSDLVDRERKKQMVSMVAVVDPDPNWRLEPTRFSNWKRLTRVNAWVFRFITNCCVPADKRVSGELSVEELNDAENRIIVQTQRDEFQKEYTSLKSKKPLLVSSKISPLHPQLDEHGVIRLSGRLTDADCLPYAARCPIILPRRSCVTKLIVKSYHEDGHHLYGTNQTLAALSSKYWIISAREVIREWERECSRCRIMKAKPIQQVMAPLPKLRLQVSLRAFSKIAVDYAGPFFTIQGRGKTRNKRYLCLFTCLSTRAVHLEMANSLDTNAFLNAFFRMVNRRGLPTDVISDNGTNFVGAVRELKQLFEVLDKTAITRSLANKGIKWHFNPPYAPHFGGVFETMVKSAKRAIFAILSTSDVTDEELGTAFTGAEALINSRPLTYQSAHPLDDNPLTPNHFLHGQIGGMFAPESADETDYHPRKRWRRLQELVRHFWRRWMREWLPSLHTRKKWTTLCKDLRVGDVVMMISPDTARGHWPLGTIIKIHPGSDGHVRVVDVQVGQNILTRPVNKMCPLEYYEGK